MSRVVDSTITAPYSNRSQHLSSCSSTSLRTAQQYDLMTTRSTIESTSGGTTSLERRACRICQSETGEMVRPCGCAGTMGDIHDTCLSKWVAMANNPTTCEICKESYAKSGSVYRPLKEWSRPEIETTDLLSLCVLCGMIYSVYYIGMLFQERMFFERFRTGYQMRADDVGRLTIAMVFFFMIVSMVSKFFKATRVYVNRQKCIRFVNKGH
ncbi:marc-1 [Pristionchus pacificus]|nr:marc-1 [Pristionchus pacificus]